MTTWSELTAYVGSNYKVAEETDNFLKLIFETGSLRSQTVWIWKVNLAADNEPWIQVESPIAKVADVDPAKALELTNNLVCGGLAVTQEYLVARHAAPLKNLDSNEVDRPLTLVTLMADELERQLTGADVF